MESWPTLPLERYALGQEDSSETFCRWMEFRTQHLGSIRGGNARKLILYKHRHSTGWYFDPQYSDEQSAWRALRGEFVRAFECAHNSDWNSIDALLGLQSGPALTLKTLHLYFPKEILPVYSKAHLHHFLALLGKPESAPIEAVGLNRALLAALRELPELEGWTTNEIQKFLYAWADPRDARRIVKIAPGEGGEFWEACLRGGYICVGWDELGDLREYDTKETFRAAFDEHFSEFYRGHQSTITRKANELWTLVELEPGDIVVANRGISEVLAVGEVVEPGYRWHPEREAHRHTVRVKWDVSYAKAIPPQKRWGVITVGPVSTSLFEIIAGSAPRGELTVPPLEPRLREIAEALTRKGQAILYGPPGTGKTYHARRFALTWLLQVAGRENEIPLRWPNRSGSRRSKRALRRRHQRVSPAR